MSDINEKTIVRCSITLEQELLERAKRYAKEQDRNLSSVFRLALKQLLDASGK